MSATPALLAAAAGVAVGHAILPDHWVPIAVLSRTRRYPLAKVARLSASAGIAHVVFSLLLGGIIIAVGLQFRSVVENAQNLVIGALLILTGLAFGVFEATGWGPGDHHDGPGHSHGPNDDHGHDNDCGLDTIAAPVGGVRSLAAVMIPFGAAASPDLTILPVFLAATAVGVVASVAALVVFSLVTMTTIVALTLFATFGGYQVQGQWLDRWGNLLTALTLVMIGGLVLTGTI